MTRNYLLSDVDLGEEEALAAAEVVRSKWLSLGPRTAEFENAFAQAMGSRHAIAVCNCTAGLHLALQAAGVGPGDEVLVPSYTFVASANCILYQGATPVFVEINGPHDLNLAVDDLAARITARTKAIIVVHMAGFPADMSRILALSRKHGLKVIEDACHAIGATVAANGPLDGRKAGTLGDAGCFSFFANKNMATGEGGMVVTDDDELARKIRLARSHGMTKSSWDKADGRAVGYDVVDLGYNYRCTELTAAIGLIQLRKLPGSNARRKDLVRHYRERLGFSSALTIPFAERLEDSAHHIFPVLAETAELRDDLRQALHQRGIQTSVHYPPVHQFSHYRKIAGDSRTLKITEEVSRRELTLPLHPLLEQNDVDFICDTVLECLEHLSPALR